MTTTGKSGTFIEAAKDNLAAENDRSNERK